MSAGRIVLAGLLGAVAMFMWTAIAHMATPLGEVGIRELPNEQALLSSMQTSIGAERGFYFFPGMGLPPDAPQSQRRAAMNEYQAKLDRNPSGILIYKPAGEKAMTFGQLGKEFGIEFVEALMLAILVSMIPLGTFGSRIAVACAVGIIAAVTTNLSYWNWYGFPMSYTMATMFVEFMKYLVAGAVIAVIAGRGSARTRSATA